MLIPNRAGEYCLDDEKVYRYKAFVDTFHRVIELLTMYDDVNEFESLKEKYLNIAKGGIPTDVETMKVSEDSANICDLLVLAGFATSRGEAKRMVTGNGVKVNGNPVTDITTMIETAEEPVIQFGKNKFKKVVKD